MKQIQSFQKHWLQLTSIVVCRLKCHKESLMQRSPKTRKFCFCVTATTRPLCVHWTTNTAVVAQQVVQRRQSGGRTIAMVALVLPWSPNGGTVVDTVIAQWTLFTVVQLRKYKLCTVLPIWRTPRPISDFCDRFHGFGGSFLYVNLTRCASDAL